MAVQLVAASDLSARVALDDDLLVHGPVALDVDEAAARTYARARELCEQAGDTAQLAPVLIGLGRFYLVRGEFQTARDIAVDLGKTVFEVVRP